MRLTLLKCDKRSNHEQNSDKERQQHNTAVILGRSPKSIFVLQLGQLFSWNNNFGCFDVYLKSASLASN
jgi:hypothetical protein